MVTWCVSTRDGERLGKQLLLEERYVPFVACFGLLEDAMFVFFWLRKLRSFEVTLAVIISLGERYG